MLGLIRHPRGRRAEEYALTGSLGFGRAVRVLVVAISVVSWFSCRSGVLQRPAGWLSEVQRAYGYYQGCFEAKNEEN